MKRFRMTAALKHLFRRSQAGQSIVILAIGFVALIGFVGIVTDVSLLFVRYSTLRRAVDAAAVAAAGQMRRVDSSAVAAADDQSISYANMGLAARQFIEFYGLNPSDVIVETCWVQNNDVATRPVDQTLCTTDQRKLVRVTAQIESPTTFFNLFGFRTIRLQASSTSETAVLDLVFIMDVSESMLTQTGYEEWRQGGYHYAYLPPVLPFLATDNQGIGVESMYGYLASRGHNEIIVPPGYVPPGGVIGQLHPSFVSGYLQPLNSGFYQSNPIATTVREISLPPAGVVVGDGRPPVQCRVRYWPYSARNASLNSADATDAAVLNIYRGALGGESALQSHFRGTTTANGATTYDWVGFVPQYNFYGCCNDPNQDGDMRDLVCQPFRDARDASISFMQRIDFVRGDRVAIVTFDREAYIMDPDPRSDTEARNAGRIERDVFLTSEDAARTVMEQAVGVRTEESFYRYTTTDPDLQWDVLVSPTREDGGTASSVSAYNDFGAPLHRAAVGSILNHPTYTACPLQMAILNYPYSLYTRPVTAGSPDPWRWGDSVAPSILAEPGITHISDAIPYANTFPFGYSNIRVTTNATRNFNRMERSYDYRATCAGTNIGGGLGQAAALLGELGRREGAVWIMVLLSDGAAGASRPAVRNNQSITPPNYFAFDSSTNVMQPQAASGGPSAAYGAFGLCPYGTPTNPGELLMDNVFPFCSDLTPSTRNWCNDTAAPAAPNQIGPNRIELNDDSSNPSRSPRGNRCVQNYDTDDYARDWADYVAVRGINLYAANASGPGIDTSRNDTDTLLPTIFTIAFGLDFGRIDGNPACLDQSLVPAVIADPVYRCNIESHLGEELLRYIADAGDNFRIDNDYWQRILGYRIPNQVSTHADDPSLPAGQTADWGPPGVCEDTGRLNRGDWRPLTPGRDCGNYWSVDTGNELEEVFAEIAARMFTRLAG
ncbi:MAG: pilus assembly protein TadG-related protein [Chloroflexota bacterium]|nr:pilus assembly protein TadG-related protein [Chloroflexota bacterium]